MIVGGDRSNMITELNRSADLVHRSHKRRQHLQRQNDAISGDLELCNRDVLTTIMERGGNPVVTGDGQSWGVFWRTLMDFRAAKLPASTRGFYMRHV
jgi:hypothetical protein